MRKIESTINEPIKFFTEFFLHDGFKEFIDEFKTWCFNEKKNYPDLVHLFDVDGDFVMHQTISNNFDDGTEDLKTTLTGNLEKELDYQLKKSKEYIDDA